MVIGKLQMDLVCAAEFYSSKEEYSTVVTFETVVLQLPPSHSFLILPVADRLEFD